MGDVAAGPAPERVWAVRHSDGGGWRLIGSEETIRVLTRRGDLRECVEYAPKDRTDAPDVRARYEAPAPNDDPDEVTAEEALAAVDEARLRAAGLYWDADRREYREPPCVLGAPNEHLAAMDVVVRNGVLQRQRDDATQEVARLSVSYENSLQQAAEASNRLAALQDDLERREAALGRAMTLGRALWCGHHNGPVLDRLGLPWPRAWADVVRWVADGPLPDDGYPAPEPSEDPLAEAEERYDRLARAVRELYNSAETGQAAFSAVTRTGAWSELKSWDRTGAGLRPQGGEQDGNEPSDAPQGQASTAPQGPEPPGAGGDPPSGDGRCGCGAEPGHGHGLGCPRRAPSAYAS